MTGREKILGAIVLAILFGLGLRSVHSRLNETYRQYDNQVAGLTDTLIEEELKVAAGGQALGLLSQWREQSLPADETHANLLYQYWLLEQLDKAGLKNVDTPAVRFTSRPGDGNILTYTLRGEGNLSDIIEFLYRFYRADHLHKISKIDFEPDDAGQRFEVVMTVEAWALADSFNTDALAEGESDRLAYDSLEEYEEAIVGRNIFAVYTPPPAKVERVANTGPPFDHAQHARATGIVNSNGEPEVWIYVLTTGDKYWLAEGESFKVGDLECRIVKIDTHSFVFEAEGKQYTVKVGSSLRDGKPVTEQATSQTAGFERKVATFAKEAERNAD